jgi:hypothetical protein
VPGIDFNTFSLMSGTKNASASFQRLIERISSSHQRPSMPLHA